MVSQTPAGTTIYYTPSSAQSTLVISTQALAGNIFPAITFDLEVDIVATVQLNDSLTGKSYQIPFPPAVQRITLEAESLVMGRRRHLEDAAARHLTMRILDCPSSARLVLNNINLVTESPTTAPTSMPTGAPSLVRLSRGPSF